MKRSEMLMWLQRHYGIRHCMVESGHLSVEDFCAEVLSLIEKRGMLPPFNPDVYYLTWRDGGTGYEWEIESGLEPAKEEKK